VSDVPAYDVVSQQEATGPDGTGSYVRGVRVTAQLKTGTQFSVFIPEARYTMDTVKGALAVKAATYAGVDNLSHPG
jgi:hypothetical protein